MRILRLGEDPGDPNDLLVPTHAVLHMPQPGTTLKDIEALPYALGGRAAKPAAAVAFRGADGGVTLLPGLGVTEAAELQDYAYALYERRQADWRERLGVPSRESVVERIQEAMAEKARYYKAHAVTDPGEAPRPRRLF